MTANSSRPLLRRLAPWIVLAVVVIAGVLVAQRFLHRNKTDTAVPVEPVGRRSIVVTVQATGTVEPINTVDVKSKASGQILRMPVQVGSVVHQGDLLAQIDPLTVRNQYNQAAAALKAAQAQVDVATAQKKRADDLYASQVITADEHETATLSYANAQSALVRAQSDLDIARQNLDDATVRAPISGTVIAQPVSVGQVISSATSSVSGGTTILSMADLRRVRINALVTESDIGSVRPGQSASVLMDAYPNRPFQGVVERIEPQAVVQQSVTMFPVLVSISNEEGLLMPGMNGEVTILVQKKDDVLAVPLDAVRSLRELPAVASALGLDPATLRTEIRSQFHGGGGEPAGDRQAARGDSTSAGRGASARTGGGRGGRGGGGAWRRGNGGGRTRGTSAGPGAGAGRTGDRTGGGAAGTGSGGGFGAGRAGGGQAQVVLVQTQAGFEPRVVRLGVSDFDYAEVLSGLEQGDQVVMLSVAEVQAQRNAFKNRIRERVGGAVPGGGGGSRGTGGSRRGG